MMKTLWIAVSLMMATGIISVGGLRCDYSGIDLEVVGSIEGEAISDFVDSWNFRLAAGAKLQKYTYQRNPTDTYDTQYSYGYNKWATESNYLSYPVASEDNQGLFGWGVSVKEDWETELNNYIAKTDDHDLPPGLAESINTQVFAVTKLDGINDMDVFGLDFNGVLVHDMTFTISNLEQNEKASYRTYREGKKMLEGTITGAEDGDSTEHAVISATGYDAIEFYVQNDDNSNYLIQMIEFCAPKSCNKDNMFVASIQGDPHIQSFDGLSYNCQGEGLFNSFIGTKHDERKFQIQSIFERGMSNNRQVTVTRAIVIEPTE